MTGWTQARQAMADLEQQCDAAMLRQEPGRFALDAADTLFRTVETEIIPRLMLLHRQDGGAQRGLGASNDRVSIGPSHVLEFCDIVLDSRERAETYLQNLLHLGVDLEALCLQLLAPTARHLGELWSADLCEFTDVTIALARLQGLLRFLSVDTRMPRQAGSMGRTALFAPAPGEQHTFGLTMVCDFFRSSGWDVWTDTPSGNDALVALVRDRRFDVVGFSIGNDRALQALAELIRAVRTSSRNRAVRVLAGGPLLIARPQIAALVGADGTAVDARQAMLEAERLVAARDEGR